MKAEGNFGILVLLYIFDAKSTNIARTAQRVAFYSEFSCLVTPWRQHEATPGTSPTDVNTIPTSPMDVDIPDSVRALLAFRPVCGCRWTVPVITIHKQLNLRETS